MGSDTGLRTGSGLGSPRPIHTGTGNVETLGISPSLSSARLTDAAYRESDFVERCTKSRYARVNFSSNQLCVFAAKLHFLCNFNGLESKSLYTP